MRFAVMVLFSAVAFAQQYQLGAVIGYGVYRNGTIYSASEKIQAGIRNRFGAGIDLSDDFSRYVAAEFQYLYHDGHPFLQGRGVKTDIQGQSDALTVNLLFHFKQREARWRPFVEGGAGAKDY